MKPKRTATDAMKYGTNRRKPLSIPEVIEKDIQSRGWVWRWGSKTKFDKMGGTDMRGYMAYRVPTELRVDPKPGTYAEDYQVSLDGLYHRGDMILLVMPRERREQNLRELADKNKINREYVKSAVESRGLTFEEAKFEKVLLEKTTNSGD